MARLRDGKGGFSGYARVEHEDGLWRVYQPDQEQRRSINLTVSFPPEYDESRCRDLVMDIIRGLTQQRRTRGV
jgi:hypothetical protein